MPGARSVPLGARRGAAARGRAARAAREREVYFTAGPLEQPYFFVDRDADAPPPQVSASDSAARKLLWGLPSFSSTPACPAGQRCLASDGVTTFSSPNLYLTQAGASVWQSPQWLAPVRAGSPQQCGIYCTALANCPGSGSCLTAAGRTTTCNYQLFGPNNCDMPANAGTTPAAYCTSYGALSVKCQCTAPTPTQYTAVACSSCTGSACASNSINVACTATCPAGSYTADTCGLGSVMFQPGAGGGGGPGGSGCGCAQLAQRMAPAQAQRLCPCAFQTQAPPAPATLLNKGTGDGSAVGQNTQCAPCSTCAVGTYMTAACVPGTSQQVGQDTTCAACTAAPANAVYVAGATSCAWKCGDGFTQSGAACVKSVLASPPMPPPPPSPAPPPPPPPPTEYKSVHELASTKAFSGKVLGGPTQHVLNNGATTSSTETTASGAVKVYETTSTTDAAVVGDGDGTVDAHATTTDDTTTAHQQTRLQRNSPPPVPVVYASGHVLARSQGFANKVVGGPTQHVLNGGATTTSTETTAHGAVNVYGSTTTDVASQAGTGNGHVNAQATSTETTSTEHRQTFAKHNTHSTTTDLTPAPAAASVAAAGALCDSAPFTVRSVVKGLCLHVKGGAGPDGFAVSTSVHRPVITMPCVAGSPNQLFSWVPTEHGGVLMHDASTLALALQTADVADGTGVVLAPATGGPQQEWVWDDATSGGTIKSVDDENFMITVRTKKLRRFVAQRHLSPLFVPC